MKEDLSEWAPEVFKQISRTELYSILQTKESNRGKETEH